VCAATVQGFCQGGTDAAAAAGKKDFFCRSGSCGSPLSVVEEPVFQAAFGLEPCSLGLVAILTKFCTAKRRNAV